MIEAVQQLVDRINALDIRMFFVYESEEDRAQAGAKMRLQQAPPEGYTYAGLQNVRGQEHIESEFYYLSEGVWRYWDRSQDYCSGWRHVAVKRTTIII